MTEKKSHHQPSSSWSVALRRQLEARGLVSFIDVPNPETDLNIANHAATINLKNEPCCSEFQEVYFVKTCTAYDIWHDLKSRFGPTNTTLGEKAQLALLSDKWQIGGDPGKFLNGIKTNLADIKYYGGVFPDESMARAFLGLIPVSRSDWTDFERNLNILPTLSWSDLQNVFLRNDNLSNSKLKAASSSSGILISVMVDARLIR